MANIPGRSETHLADKQTEKKSEDPIHRKTLFIPTLSSPPVSKPVGRVSREIRWGSKQRRHQRDTGMKRNGDGQR